jgi:hypothetical protein
VLIPVQKPQLQRNQQVFKYEKVKGVISASNPNRISFWNSEGRPANPKTGALGLNIETSDLEYWNGSYWLKLKMKRTDNN